MEQPEEITFSWSPMEEQPDLLLAPMEQQEEITFSWAPVKEQGLRGLLADQQFCVASAAAIEPQTNVYSAHDDDATVILQLLEEPRDEGDLDGWLSGYLLSSPSQETIVNHQMEGRKNGPGGTRNFPSKKRGTRKKRTSPWNPAFLKRIHLARTNGVCTSRTNNSRWTHEEVESLVTGISKYGVGRWTEVKGMYFSESIRTSVNLKDKWRNLLKAYDDKLTSKKKKVQKTTLLHLEEPLIKRIRKLADKHRRDN